MYIIQNYMYIKCRTVRKKMLLMAEWILTRKKKERERGRGRGRGRGREGERRRFIIAYRSLWFIIIIIESIRHTRRNESNTLQCERIVC